MVFESLCRDLGLSPSAVVLKYFRSLSWANYAVLGCENVEQLRENHKSINSSELASEVSYRTHEPAAGHCRFTGLHTSHSPILSFTTVDHTRHATKVICHIRPMKYIVIKVLSYHSSLVTAAYDKITYAMRRINTHHVPKNRFSNFNTTATSGTTSVGGLFYYDTYNLEQLVTIANGRLHTIDSGGIATTQPANSTWSASTSTWGNATRRWATGFDNTASFSVNMAQFNNLLYFVDGDGPLFYWDGSVAQRQGGKLRFITVSTAGTGYTTASVNVTGPQISGTRPTVLSPTVAGGAITGITVSDGGMGYISAPAVTISGDGNGATATARVSPPPTAMRLLAVVGNRLIGVGSGQNRNTLYASDILDASVWDNANSIVIGGDDGDEVSAIVPFYANRLIVFKKSKIFQVTIPPDMASAADWTVEVLTTTTGCAAEKTALQVNGTYVLEVKTDDPF